MTEPAAVPRSRPPDTIARWLLAGAGVYSLALVTLLNVVFVGSGSTDERAVILMADGLILLWVVVGGALTLRLRSRLVPRLRALRVDWRVRFVALCTALALLEEVITTGMTNLAPLFGTTPERAHITASTNYFEVVCFHSVVVFVPLFAAWAWMLSRWRFTPLEVMLLFGLTGSLAEASLQWTSLFGGFWVFVYGLMIYLPACTVPPERPARRPSWWHYPLAVVLPLPFAILAAPIIWVRERLGIEFLPGV